MTDDIDALVDAQLAEGESEEWVTREESWAEQVSQWDEIDEQLEFEEEEEYWRDLPHYEAGEHKCWECEQFTARPDPFCSEECRTEYSMIWHRSKQ